MTWTAFDGGQSIGQTGSEGGTILRDDEHTDGARITLERGDRIPFSITCGIYGWFFHTRFASNRRSADQDFEQMRDALATILGTVYLAGDIESSEYRERVTSEIVRFVDRYP